MKKIDIREKYEYENNPTNRPNVPMNDLLMNPDKYIDKVEQVYVYCQSGMRANRTATYLQSQGYNVIAGGGVNAN